MRYSAEHTAASRSKLVKAAAKVFRERGYAGAGVDQVSAEAGVTIGSLYKHFASKSLLLREVVAAGADRLARRIRNARGAERVDPAGGWVNDFATAQTSREHLANLALGCNLPSLSIEVARAEVEVRQAYQDSILAGVEALIEAEPFAGRPDAEAAALALLSVLAGGAMLARGVADTDLADRVADAARRAALLIAGDALPEVPRSQAAWAPMES